MNNEIENNPELLQSEQRLMAANIARSLESGNQENFTGTVQKLFESFKVKDPSEPPSERVTRAWDMEFQDWSQKVQSGDKYIKSDVEIDLPDGSYANFYLERYQFDEPVQGLKSPIIKISPGACSINKFDKPSPEDHPADAFYHNFQEAIGTDHYPLGIVERKKAIIDNPQIFVISENMPTRMAETEAQELISKMLELAGK